MLISEEYRKLNHDLHLSDAGYGRTLPKFVKLIRPLVRPGDTVLNYGCGKSILTCGKINRVTNYDPAIPGLDSLPEPADVVICTDVLEHIEPECLDEVLDHLQTLTKRDAFFTVATVPSSKTLADGRNSHLIQHECEWWLPKFYSRFVIRNFNNAGFSVVLHVSAIQIESERKAA